VYQTDKKRVRKTRN